eukprot:TRINITY_DN1353_c0_g2_i13.p1 TRINITY_DN1353_c0_g2~~TRINITY_DN1353_c0_g2_i13.p1  ORF type:complete len:249 (+),score=53.06 TRINITY_DN1353_c0_g2_i13:373-1119(+)
MSGERTTPSYVSIHTEGNLVGITARKQALISPRNTFYHFKGLLGQSYDPETHKDGSVRYKLTAGENNSVAVQDEAGTTYSIPQITSFVLKRMKETAENNLGTTVQKAVLGVPVYFTKEQTNALTEAAKLTGLDVTFTPEPIAAALALKISSAPNKTLFVFDLGGMTLDLTVLEMGPKIKIRAASTNPNLGGQLFTDKLIHFLIENFASETGINLREENLHTQALQRIFTAAEVAKCELSTGLVNESKT